MVAATLMSLDEFKELPDDGYRHELIRGVLYRKPPRKPRHGRVAATVGSLVDAVAEANNLGTVYSHSGFIMPGEPDTLVAPDLAFVQKARLPIDEDDYPILAPDLVIEVVLPDDGGPPIAEKTEIYLNSGVRLAWVIDPIKRTAPVRKPDGTDHLLTANDTLNGEDVLTGFHLPVAQLFV